MKYVDFIDQTGQALKKLGVSYLFHMLPGSPIVSIGVHEQVVSINPKKVTEVKNYPSCVVISCNSVSSVTIYSSYLAVLI